MYYFNRSEYQKKKDESEKIGKVLEDKIGIFMNNETQRAEKGAEIGFI
jgi:hypothetical protein